MTPGTRLLEACRELVRLDGGGSTLDDVLGATYALKGARALYPAAHAIGDRVLAEENDGSPAGLATVIAIRFTVEKVNYKLRFEDTLQKVWFDAAYVHPAPPPMPFHNLVDDPPTTTLIEPSSETGSLAEALAAGDVAPFRGRAAKNEYVCLLLGGNPLTRCVLASGHEGTCVAEKDQRVTREQLLYPPPGEPFDYDSLTDDEKASLRKTPLYDRAKELGLVDALRFVDNTPSIPILTLEPGGDTVTFGRNAATVNLTTGKVTLPGDVDEAARAFWAAVEQLAPKR